MDPLSLIPLPILLYLSVIDIKTRDVPEIPVTLMFLFGVVYFFLTLESMGRILSSLILQAISFLLYLRGAIADGDHYILLSLSFFIKDILSFLLSFFISSFAIIIGYSMTILRKKNKRKFYILLALSTLLVISIFLPSIFILISFLLVSAYLLSISKDLSEVREIPIENLVEGDILLEDIKIDDKIVFKNPGRSLTKEEVERIKKLGIKKVKILWGAPFVTSIFLAYLLYITL